MSDQKGARMKFWINPNLNNDNVIILAKTAVLIGSCEKLNLAQLEQKLRDNIHPFKALEKSAYKTLIFDRVTTLSSHQDRKAINSKAANNQREKKSNRIDVSVANGDAEKIHSIEFADAASKADFLQCIEGLLLKQWFKARVAPSALQTWFAPVAATVIAVVLLASLLFTFSGLLLVCSVLWTLAATALIVYRLKTTVSMGVWSRSPIPQPQLSWRNLVTEAAAVFMAAAISVIGIVVVSTLERNSAQQQQIDSKLLALVSQEVALLFPADGSSAWASDGLKADANSESGSAAYSLPPGTSLATFAPLIFERAIGEYEFLRKALSYSQRCHSVGFQRTEALNQFTAERMNASGRFYAIAEILIEKNMAVTLMGKTQAAGDVSRALLRDLEGIDQRFQSQDNNPNPSLIAECETMTQRLETSSE